MPNKTKNRKTIYKPKYEFILNRLRETRKQLGFSQQYVGEKLGKYQSFVAKIESGERRIDIIELLELSKIYNKDISYFVPK